MTKRHLLLALVLLLVAALAVIVWYGGAAPPDSGADSATDARSPAAEQGGAPPAAAEAAPPASEPAPVRERAPDAAAYRITGRVRAAPEFPLAGARILAHRGSPEDRSGLLGGIMSSFERIGQPNTTTLALLPKGAPLASAELGNDGAFTLDVPERHLLLWLEHTHYALTEALPVHVPPQAMTANAGLLEPYLGAFVRGRLIGAQGEIHESVRLVAELDPMAVIQDPEGFLGHALRGGSLTAKVAADATFEMRAVWPTAQAFVLFHQEAQCARAGPLALAAGETRELALHVALGASLTVRVRDEDGAALARTKITVAPQEQQGMYVRVHALRSGETDDHGACTIAGLADGGYRVTARPAGYVPARGDVAIAQRQDAELALVSHRGASVAGKVVDASGAPVADAGVSHQEEIDVPMVGDVLGILGEDLLSMGAAKAPCRSDTEGRFTLSGLEDRGKPIAVVANHEGYVGGVARNVAIGATDVVITLRRAGRVVGRALDASTREPIAELTAQTVVTMFMFLERPTRSTVVTDSKDGAFALEDVPPGKVKLRVHAQGYAPFETGTTIEPETTNDVGAIELQPEAAIIGRVVDDASSEPLANALVRRKQGGFADHPILAKMMAGSATRTDKGGRFELRGLQPGGHILLASADGYASDSSKRLRIAAGEVLDGVEIRLGHGGTVVGRLLLPPDEEVEAWQVIPASSQMGGMTAVHPGPDGSFRLENLEPGRYEIQAIDTRSYTQFHGRQDFDDIDIGALMETANRNSIRSRCTVNAGEIVEVVLDGRDRGASGAVLSGRVLLGNAPMDAGWIEAAQLGGEHEELLTGFVQDGAFELRGVRPGRVRLQVRRGMLQAPVGEPKVVEIAAGGRQQVELRLPGGSIEGRVVHDRTGEPLPDALVRLTPADAAGAVNAADMGFVITDRDGAFAFHGLGEGVFHLVADEQLLKSSGEKAGGRLENVRVEAGQRVEGLVLLARPAAGALVTVTDEIGAPREGALLLAVDAEGRPVGTMPLAVSNAEGKAFLAGLPPGETRIVGRAPGLAPGWTDVQQVLPDKETTFDLSLRRGPRVTLSIERADGSRLRDAVVSVRFERGPWISATVLQSRPLADGTIDLGAMLPGRYELLVAHHEVGAFKAERAVPPGQRTTLVLTAPQ
jgi:protocatechuate 3,4-dioxygenase beta subunit